MGWFNPLPVGIGLRKKNLYDMVSVLECLMILVLSIFGDPKEEPLLKLNVSHAMRLYVILELGTGSYLICWWWLQLDFKLYYIVLWFKMNSHDTKYDLEFGILVPF